MQLMISYESKARSFLEDCPDSLVMSLAVILSLVQRLLIVYLYSQVLQDPTCHLSESLPPTWKKLHLPPPVCTRTLHTALQIVGLQYGSHRDIVPPGEKEGSRAKVSQTSERKEL